MNQKIVTRITTALFLFLLILIFIYGSSLSGLAQAQKESSELVSLDYPDHQMDNFYWFSFEETYFSLSFIDSEGYYRYGIINQDGGNTNYYTVDDIISHEEAYQIAEDNNKKIEILEVRLGMIDNQPVWEISFKDTSQNLTYYYLDAKNGNWLQTISNL